MRASPPCSRGEVEHEDPSKFITDPLNQEIYFEPNTPDPKLLISKNAPDSNLLQHTSSKFSMFIFYFLAERWMSRGIIGLIGG